MDTPEDQNEQELEALRFAAEQELYEKLAETEPVILKDALSHRRAQALVVGILKI